MRLPKILFACFFCFVFASLPAQNILNGGFETTVITSNDTVPEHWSMDQIGAAISTNAHSGNNAVVIWNWYYYVEGWLNYGAAQNAIDDGGLPVSFNPDQLTGWYQYIHGDNGGTNDSATCQVYLYSYQNFAGTRDTIGSGFIALGPSSIYKTFEVPITYTSQGIPADSIIVKFSSSRNGNCYNFSNGNCLYLYLDDLEISNATGVVQSLDGEAGLKLYPSPSKTGFHVAATSDFTFPMKVEILDLQGKLVMQEELENEHEMIGQNLPSGHYIWKLESANGLLQSGTVVVE